MAIIHIEKLGGLAGFGGVSSHLRSRGRVDTDDLSQHERTEIDELFTKAVALAAAAPVADGFRYRVTRSTHAGTETIEIPEEHMPAALAASVKDELV